MGANRDDNQRDAHVIVLRPRNVVAVLLIVAAFALAAALVVVAWHVLTWVLIAAFLAVALNPAVTVLERRLRHGLACAIIFAVALALVASVAAVAMPPLITQMHALYQAAPRLLDELAKGHGQLGFLERRFHLGTRLQTAIAAKHAAAPALALAKGVVASVAELVTIAFLTLFMLLEGRVWVERSLSLVPAGSRERWHRSINDIYHMIVGYAVGNLVISLIAAAVTLVALWVAHVPYALPLAALVAVLDLVPIAGALVGGAIVTAVAFTVGTATGIVVLAVFLCYHQIEGHLLQPLIYGRTVRLSPLAVLVAILLGARFAGVLGAVAAIPVAATVQILASEATALRRTSDADDQADG